MKHTLMPDVVITFSAECCKKYTGIAFDGQFFYLTLPQENKIGIFNRDFILTECCSVGRPYTAICYDPAENCFWASEEQTNDNLYKLSLSLEEIGCIELCQCRIDGAGITGLSCNCDRDSILVAFANCIAEYSKCGRLIQILQKASRGLYSGVLSISPCYAAVRRCEHTQVINIFSAQGQFIKSYCLSSHYSMEALVFQTCPDPGKNAIVLIILATDPCCCSCILKCRINLCGIKLCPCHCGCCQNCCDPVCDVLESIALVEASLSHILNAEGEKLQKAVKTADNICELIEIDKAVNKTIMNVTLLEQTLYAKLETLSCLDPEDCCENKAGCRCFPE